jgi:hypothetical protein
MGIYSPHEMHSLNFGKASAGGNPRRTMWSTCSVGAKADVAEPPELFQLKCLSPTLEAIPHLSRNKTSVPRI